MSTRSASVLPEHVISVIILVSILFVRILPIIIYIEHKGTIPDIIYKDHYIYLWSAKNILTVGTNPFDFFPPLNTLFIAGILWLSNGNIGVATAAMAIVGWLTVVVIYIIAQKLFDTKTALYTAILCGLYPNFIMYGITFCSENLGTFWICVMFLLLIYYRITNRIIFLVGMGITMGIAAQTRGGLHYFAPFFLMGLFLLRYKKQKIYFFKESFTFIVPLLLSLYSIGWLTSPIQKSESLNPRSGIGSVVHGANRITTSCADYGDIRGNVFYFINDTKEPWPQGSQLFSEELMALPTVQILKKTVLFIMEKPLIYIKNSLLKLSCFWSPNQLVIATIKLKLQPYNAIANTISLTIVVLYLVLIIGGLFGLILSHDPLKPFFIFFIVFYCILIFFTVGNSKLRLPLMPLFIMYSSFFFTMLVQKRKVIREKILRHKTTIIFASLLVANGVWRCIEILPEPAEIYVRQIELCNQLGFPKTACVLLKKYQAVPYFNDDQKKRLRKELEQANCAR